jgi:hypothetical protein
MAKQKKDLSSKIRKIMAEGKSYRQAVAIAISMTSKKRKSPSRPKRGGRTQTNKRRTKR